MDRPIYSLSVSLDWVDISERLHRVFNDLARDMIVDIYGRRMWEVTRLKAETAGDLGVGGPTIAAPLIAAGLVDEYRLFVHPVLLGSGTPSFPPLEQQRRLELLERRSLDGGVEYLRYRPANLAAS